MNNAMDLERLSSVMGETNTTRALSCGVAVHENNNNKTPMVRRTQSYDGVEAVVGFDAAENDGLVSDAQSPLHVSFDVSQLNAYRFEENGGNQNEMPPPPGTTRKQLHLSFDNVHDSNSNFTTSSAVGPLPRNYLDILHGASNSSHSSSATTMTTTTSTARTPVRARVHKGASCSSKKLSVKRTPASARRHRLFNRRSSPAHRTPAFTTRSMSDPSQQQNNKNPTQSLLHPPAPSFQSMNPPSSIWKQPEFQREQSAALLMEPAATPANGAKSAKRSLGTVTTVANTTILETTTETDDSAESSGAVQTFQFTAFPASLPRITTNAPEKRPLQDGFHNAIINNKDADPANSGLPITTDQCSSAQGQQQQPEQQHARHPSFAVGSEFGVDDMDEEMTASPMGTPVGRRKLNFNMVLSPSEASESPGTPKDVRMHFQSKECSPIRGIPEEDGDLTSSVSEKHAASLLNHSMESNSASTGSSHQGTNGSGGSGSRPMPDMNAFEMDTSHDSSSDKAGSGASARSHVQSPKLLCPPTPVRTPAWVHGDSSHSKSSLTEHHSNAKGLIHHAKFGRQNSLIATKVLATCSQRDLEGRTSLENSLLEEDGSKQLGRSREYSTANSSILTGTSGGDVSTIAEVCSGPVVEHPSLDKDNSFQHHHHHDNSQSTEEDDSWLHDRRRDNRLFDDDDDDEAMPSSSEDVSMATSFEILGMLGRGTFADVYKVRSKKDGHLYAVKKHRRQFRGRRDREMTMAEVRHMQRLQSTKSNNAKSSYCLYLLFFYQAWQEEGHFFCQTELCCRDTCREFMDSLRLNWVTSRSRYPSLRQLPAPLGIAAGSDQDIIGRMVPERTVWKICHDISAGLSHMHSHGLVHHDIKPSNVFFVAHSHFGAMCKIGDFGMAGDIGTSEDGQEGDQKYMAPELLASDVKHPNHDMFSLGLTLYELASSLSFEVPSEGHLWHELRSGKNSNNPVLELPSSRNGDLVRLIRLLIHPDRNCRLGADAVLQVPKVQSAGITKDDFLTAYVGDVEDYDRRAQDVSSHRSEDQTPRVLAQRPRLCISPSLSLPSVPAIAFSSPKQAPPFA